MEPDAPGFESSRSGAEHMDICEERETLTPLVRDSESETKNSTTYHKVVRLNAEQVPKVPERDRRVDLKLKLAVVVRGCHAGALRREGYRLQLPEVHHQQIAPRFRRQAADRMLDAELDRAHDRGGLDFLVRNFAPLADPPMADFALLVRLWPVRPRRQRLFARHLWGKSEKSVV